MNDALDGPEHIDTFQEQDGRSSIFLVEYKDGKTRKEVTVDGEPVEEHDGAITVNGSKIQLDEFDGQGPRKMVVKTESRLGAFQNELIALLRATYQWKRHDPTGKEIAPFPELLDFDINSQTFVMEYMEGQPLLKHEFKNLSDKDKYDICASVLNATSFLNSIGVAHLDQHANNIIVRNDKSGRMEARLLDFGAGGVSGKDTEMVRIKSARPRHGPPHSWEKGANLSYFRAPEQLNNNSVEINGPKAEAYGNASLILNLFFGRNLLVDAVDDDKKDPSVPAERNNILNLEKLRASIESSDHYDESRHKKLVDLCLTNLEADPDKRTASNDELFEALAEAAQIEPSERIDAKQYTPVKPEVKSENWMLMHSVPSKTNVKGQFFPLSANRKHREYMAKLDNAEWKRELEPEYQDMFIKYGFERLRTGDEFFASASFRYLLDDPKKREEITQYEMNGRILKKAVEEAGLNHVFPMLLPFYEEAVGIAPCPISRAYIEEESGYRNVVYPAQIEMKSEDERIKYTERFGLHEAQHINTFRSVKYEQAAHDPDRAKPGDVIKETYRGWQRCVYSMNDKRELSRQRIGKGLDEALVLEAENRMYGEKGIQFFGNYIKDGFYIYGQCHDILSQHIKNLAEAELKAEQRPVNEQNMAGKEGKIWGHLLSVHRHDGDVKSYEEARDAFEARFDKGLGQGAFRQMHDDLDEIANLKYKHSFRPTLADKLGPKGDNLATSSALKSGRSLDADKIRSVLGDIYQVMEPYVDVINNARKHAGMDELPKVDVSTMQIDTKSLGKYHTSTLRELRQQANERAGGQGKA
ncbi:MAG: serine/threonine-protein kinase [Rickettsiales bacterium]|nr:serine/threonine-protein kinase [Rickettsiales bacterium]